MAENSSNLDDRINFPSFDDLFSGLIAESKLLTIKYEQFIYKSDTSSRADIIISSVNDCPHVNDFTAKIHGLCESSFENLRDAIKPYPSSEKVEILGHIKSSLDSLKNGISDEIYFLIGSDLKTLREIPFKMFRNYELICTNDNAKESLYNNILYKAKDYVDLWLMVIDSIIEKISFLINNYDLMHDRVYYDSDRSLNEKEKIKTSLNVDELAYLFMLLADTKVFNIPEGDLAKYFRIIAESFSTKRADNISDLSLRNKAYSPDHKTIDSLHGKFVHLMQRAMSEKEKF